MHSHEHFMHIALDEAKKALAAGEFPVGCVLVYNNEVIARGHRAHSGPENRNELDHAEIVALHNLFETHPDINPGGITCYCTMEPCLMCFAALLLSQVCTIVYGYEDAMGGGTKLPLGTLTPLYKNMKVDILPAVLRAESLALFKEFFSNKNTDYWQDSYLAEYTLSK